MVVLSGTGDKSGSGVLNRLELFKAHFGTLYKRDLQWSSLEDTKAWTRISVVFVDKNFLIQRCCADDKRLIYKYN